MKHIKPLLSILIVVLLAVSISGCSGSGSSGGHTTTAQKTNAGATETYTPRTWTMLDKDYTFDNRIYMPFELDKTTKLTIILNLPNSKSLDYIGIIPEPN